MILVHISDLHVSRFGARLASLQDAPRRVANGRGWDVVRTEGQWSIQARLANGKLPLRSRFRLVDDLGVVHRVLRVRKGEEPARHAIDALLRLMELRQSCSPQALAREFPSSGKLKKLLQADPDNLNLRFCAVAQAVVRENPDHVVISGDLTDDADGFELILEGLGSFFERGQVTCVPGNHDIYPSPPLWVSRTQRKSEADKRALWAGFAGHVGLPPSGAFVRPLSSRLVIVGLDSCHRPPLPGSASGLVPGQELKRLRQELAGDKKGVRIACLHHHVINPPVRFTGLPPLQAGMRLRNAKDVFETLRELQFDLVMNGHRHVGYRFHPPRSPLYLSAPSATIGCRSGEPPYYWRVQVEADGIGTIREVEIPLAHAADPLEEVSANGLGLTGS